VANFYSQQSLDALVNLPLSVEAFQQWQNVQILRDEQALSDQCDVWTCDWGQFSASKAYKFLMGHNQIPRAFFWLWETFCQPKHKVFFWLLMKDRLSTMNILRRKNMNLESSDCALCQLNTEETMEHLFLSCPFAAECWSKIGVSIIAQNSIFDAIQNIKDQTHPQFFMVMAILMSWSIWTARNNLIFRGIQ